MKSRVYPNGDGPSLLSRRDMSIVEGFASMLDSLVKITISLMWPIAGLCALWLAIR